MREVSDRLDRVETLPPGRGRLDVGAILRGDFTGGLGGLGVSYEHRIGVSDAVYAEGLAGYGWGDRRGLEYSATVGWRHWF